MSDQGNGDRTFVTITNRDVWNEVHGLREDVQGYRDEIRDYRSEISDYAQTKARVRALEFKFYGLLAGVVGAVIILVAKGGIPV